MVLFDTHRICNTCAEYKPIVDFSPAGPYHKHQCKACVARIKRERYASLSTEQRRVANKKNSIRKYKVDEKFIANLLFNQDYCCKICNTSFEYDSDINIDHDHLTQKVRGLLCVRCNVGLGMFTDNITFLESAITYLKEA